MHPWMEGMQICIKEGPFFIKQMIIFLIFFYISQVSDMAHGPLDEEVALLLQMCILLLSF